MIYELTRRRGLAEQHLVVLAPNTKLGIVRLTIELRTAVCSHKEVIPSVEAH